MVRCIVCNALHTPNDCYPCCSTQCENEIYDRGYEAYQDEVNTNNLSEYRDQLDWMENTEPVVVEECKGYVNFCACDTCMESYRARREAEGL